MPALGRYCCKSLKTPGDKFPSRRPNKPRSLIDVASGSLPRSPVSLSPGDEVPHMFTRKPHLRLEKFAMTCTKRFFATKSANNGLMQRSIRTIIRSPHPRRPAACWHGEAERFGGIEIDRQRELCWKLDWQIASLGPLQNLMNIVGKIVGSRNDIANAAIRSRSLMNSASPGTMTQSTCSPAYASKALPSCSGEPTSSDTSLTPNAFAAASASCRCGGLDALFM